MCINWGRSACVQPARSYAHQLNPEFLQERPGLKARVVDGKKMASTIHSEVAAEVKAMVQKGQRSIWGVALDRGVWQYHKDGATSKHCRGRSHI